MHQSKNIEVLEKFKSKFNYLFDAIEEISIINNLPKTEYHDSHFYAILDKDTYMEKIICIKNIKDIDIDSLTTEVSKNEIFPDILYIDGIL